MRHMKADIMLKIGDVTVQKPVMAAEQMSYMVIHRCSASSYAK